MVRELRHTVLAGGVVYPAGTPATAELEERIADDHWTGDKGAKPAAESTDETPKRTTRKRSTSKKSQDSKED